ncbi:signal transduction histidine kinase [Thermocatellispora tengchongensis]|uniref:histidine kinase n=2 Tax=Thermocatellispora tengchongensis TaxID=1073253 RepID=A0A840P4T2_9ACTN|nr:histidine kinase [Thermocatellispora tengchongensis]MBB5132913.1 signal transduction histidine kinase [Thermocatellispora tengchongensis]
MFRSHTADRTLRRGLLLALGAASCGAYLLAGAALVAAPWRLDEQPATAGLVQLVLVQAVLAAGALAFAAGLVPAVRRAELRVVRVLLRVRFEPVPSRSVRWQTRLRAGVWHVLHVFLGAAVAVAFLVTLSVIASVPAWLSGPAGHDLAPWSLRGPLDFMLLAGTALIGVLALGCLVGAAGALADRLVRPLLGPSSAELLAAERLIAADLAARSRLSKEVHDSVGHALTVTLMQAGGAERLLDTDPEFVREMLKSIQQTSRSALSDLDHVLSLLKDGTTPAPTVPHGALTDLDKLIGPVTAGGLTVRHTVIGDAARLPAAVSRVGYRVVQEALTNVLRHGGPGVTELRVTIDETAITIECVNPLSTNQRPVPPGMGLTSMRHQVLALGGDLTAGAKGSQWLLAIRLPLAVPR